MLSPVINLKLITRLCCCLQQNPQVDETLLDDEAPALSAAAAATGNSTPPAEAAVEEGGSSENSNKVRHTQQLCPEVRRLLCSCICCIAVGTTFVLQQLHAAAGTQTLF
jgi:hypothetical protein